MTNEEGAHYMFKSKGELRKGKNVHEHHQKEVNYWSVC